MALGTLAIALALCKSRHTNMLAISLPRPTWQARQKRGLGLYFEQDAGEHDKIQEDSP